MGRIIVVMYYATAISYSELTMNFILFIIASDRKVANSSGDDEQRERLLGFNRVDGVSFVSHVAGK